MLRPIGITGKIAAGKDTFADMLVAHESQKFFKYSLASPMKQIAHEIFGFTYKQLYDHERKEIVDPFWNITPRHFLQIVGTEMFRDCFRDDVWLKLAERQMHEHDDKHIVISDVRFENEAQFILDHGGMIIKIIRPGQEGCQGAEHHSSEMGIPEQYIHHVISNIGSLESLQASVNSLWVPQILADDKNHKEEE